MVRFSVPYAPPPPQPDGDEAGNPHYPLVFSARGPRCIAWRTPPTGKSLKINREQIAGSVKTASAWHGRHALVDICRDDR
jgi:hypothetical protein